ncbi:MAG: hypothetical protein ACRCWQ_00750 [Bacilli bacterium]
MDINKKSNEEQKRAQILNLVEQVTLLRTEIRGIHIAKNKLCGIHIESVEDALYQLELECSAVIINLHRQL